jgi:hypothetical protein
MSRARRHLNILALSAPLHRQARALQGDVNASFLLVHGAMSRAFADPAEPEAPAPDLARTLHADLLAAFRKGEGSGGAR